MDLFSQNEKISNKQVAKVLEAYLFAMRQKCDSFVNNVLEKFGSLPKKYRTMYNLKEAIAYTHNCMIDNLIETIRELESEENKLV